MEKHVDNLGATPTGSGSPLVSPRSAEDTAAILSASQDATTSAPARPYADDRIREIAEQAKAEGLKVYTFDKASGGKIEQVYITDGTKIATLHTCYSICIGTSTLHKPIRGSGIGTGFGLETSEEHTVNLEAVKKAMNTTAPRWATPTQRAAVRKYASWEEYTTANNWTTYTQL